MLALKLPSNSMIFATAFLYPGSDSNLSMYAHNRGYFSLVKEAVLPLAAMRG
jgi:hypothetical protein